MTQPSDSHHRAAGTLTEQRTPWTPRPEITATAESARHRCGNNGVQDLLPRTREPHTTARKRLTITVDGDLASGGRLALSELARIAGELQAELERVARVLAGSDNRTGRRPADIVEGTRLDLVGFRSGSAVLEVEAHRQEATLLPSLLDESLDAFFGGIDALVANPTTLPHGFDRGVVNGLQELTGGLGRAVSTIRIDRPGRSSVVIDHTVKQAVKSYQRREITEELRISGRLHMGDFAPSALRCRIDTAQGPVTCDFDSELRDQVLAAMDRVVTAHGAAERWSDSGAIRVLHLSGVEPVNEAETLSVTELIAQQGVRPIEDSADLAGPLIDDFDEFLRAIRSLRQA